MSSSSLGSHDELAAQLLELGAKPGGVLLVHTSFSKVAPIKGGPLELIAALQTAVGSKGTLVMPSMSDDDHSPFDPKKTSCLAMGVVADTFWRLPRVLRSNSPHSFAAVGPKAPDITAEHPLDVPHGLNSPVGRVYELDGQVLLLGVGHDADTTVHLAETMAGVRYRMSKNMMILKDARTSTSWTNGSRRNGGNSGVLSDMRRRVSSAHGILSGSRSVAFEKTRLYFSILPACAVNATRREQALRVTLLRETDIAQRCRACNGRPS